MTKQTPHKHPGTRLQSPLWGIAASMLFVAALLALLIYFDVQDQVLHLLRWFDAQGAWAPLLFILIMAAVVVLVLPGVLLTTGAGFVFGVVEGTLIVVTGTTLGATLAFLIARYRSGNAPGRSSWPALNFTSEQGTDAAWLEDRTADTPDPVLSQQDLQLFFRADPVLVARLRRRLAAGFHPLLDQQRVSRLDRRRPLHPGCSAAWIAHRWNGRCTAPASWPS